MTRFLIVQSPSSAFPSCSVLDVPLNSAVANYLRMTPVLLIPSHVMNLQGQDPVRILLIYRHGLEVKPNGDELSSEFPPVLELNFQGSHWDRGDSHDVGVVDLSMSLVLDGMSGTRCSNAYKKKTEIGLERIPGGQSSVLGLSITCDGWVRKGLAN